MPTAFPAEMTCTRPGTVETKMLLSLSWPVPSSSSVNTLTDLAGDGMSDETGAGRGGATSLVRPKPAPSARAAAATYAAILADRAGPVRCGSAGVES